MELEDLIMLGACSLVAGQSASWPPTEGTIETAVKVSKQVWEETLKQQRENRD